MIIVNGISKSFGEKEIISNLSFEIEEGKTVAFMGASGIGKTTLMRIIAGLTEPDSGLVTGADKLRKSYVFQENRLLIKADALTNILAVTNDRDRALYYLEKTGLAGDINTGVQALSGGMKRRLAIARSLAYGGDIFFMDEPLRELDEQTNAGIMKLMKSELAGKTVILVTHDPESARFLADRIITFGNSPLEIISDEN